ncbi:MAG: peptidoglycan-binding domain-containing protein [Cyanobacteria bacterium J06623_5]
MGRSQKNNSAFQQLTAPAILSALLTAITLSVEFAQPATAQPNTTSQPNTTRRSTTTRATSPTQQLAQAALYPTLTEESTGESVRQLQAILKLLGFYQGSIDGNYTPPTQTAVASFQSTAGIVADGIAGPSTWQKLLPNPNDLQNAVGSGTAQGSPTAPPAPAANATPAAATPPAEASIPSGPPILRPDAEGPAVAQLQRELQALGYYNGAIDGGYGAQTQAAVEEFQADQQLVVDAVVGPATWDALTRALNSL